MSNWFATSNLAVIVSLPVSVTVIVSVNLCFEVGVRDATRENLQGTKLCFVHRLDWHTNNVQLNYDAEYNLNSVLKSKVVVVSRGIHEIACDASGRLRFLSWHTREGSVSRIPRCRIAMHLGRIRLSINAACARGCEVLMIDWYKLRFWSLPVSGKWKDAHSTLRICLFD